MTEKLHEYQGLTGRIHTIRDKFREKWSGFKEQHPSGVKQSLKEMFLGIPSSERTTKVCEDSPYYHNLRRKSRMELMRISAAVMGIEFSYAGETAFVSPTLLQIGVEHTKMTLVWALSPLIGFFLTPVLGSVSDRCRSRFGRRRPFLVLMSLGVLFGLLLVPNGEDLGYLMGDPRPINRTEVPQVLGPRSAVLETKVDHHHPWGVFFTVFGTVFLDFDADACQSPARAYLLDVTVPEDHAKGLSTFTIMAGLGGFMGYALGGINWDLTSIGQVFGGHVRAVFSLITIIFVVCVTATITSFKEIPLDELQEQEEYKKLGDQERQAGSDTDDIDGNLEKQTLNVEKGPEYGSVNQSDENQRNSNSGNPLTLKHYLRSILVMPNSMRVVCLTNLFCWMAHVCYSLYFTDFVGEAVFGGDPMAADGTESKKAYEEGVRFGCWGMAMYSLSCACYSMIIENLIKRHGAKKVYVGGLCTYSCGMFLLCAIRAKAAVILFSWTAGVMYSTLFTMPYLLISHYHNTGKWADGEGGAGGGDGSCGSDVEARGLGTDVAVVSSCVFVAQLAVSLVLGSCVRAAGSTAAVVAVAATLAAAAALTATKITYLDL